MPYIAQEYRHNTDDELDDLYGLFCAMRDRCTPGDLNYIITRIITVYYETKGPGYTQLNDAIGVLESAKQEFYRRVVVPYEEQKRKEQGDVY